LSKESHTIGRVLRSAATVVIAAALVVAAAGCGGDDRADAARANAINSLYAIDHDGAAPKGNALAPYEKAFDAVEAECGGSVEGLASSILGVASDASNGSGTRITNLEAMRAVGNFLRERPPPSEDCQGVFVGVEAYLEGGALG
jgi:hypothetical protein